MMNAKCGMMNAPRMLALAIMLILAGGCSLQDIDRASARGTRPVVVVSDSVAGALPVVQALDQATDRRLPVSALARTERTGARISTVGRVAGGVLSGLGLPGAGALLAAIGGLAGAVAGAARALRNRRALDAALAGADKLPGAGKAIADSARKAGVGDLVEARYREAVR